MKWTTIACLATLATNLAAPLAFAEETQVSLSRTAASGSALTTQLSKDEYRYEERVETYYVQVPYDVEVPYEDTETYYTHETQCENVPRQHEECHNETRCSSEPRTECHEEQRCNASLSANLAFDIEQLAAPNRGGGGGGSRTVPGHSNPGNGGGNGGGHGHPDRGNGGGNHGGGNGNGGGGNGNGGGNDGGGNGGGGSSCSTVNICRTYNENICRSEPVCHTETRVERECHDVAIPHTRQVTRYRTETHYRTEERQRVVTDKIFDHSWTVGVAVAMPEEASLLDGESEAVLVRLTGSESAPDVEVMVNSNIFSYRVADKQVVGRQINVQLEMVARYTPDQLGQNTISGLALVKGTDGSYAIRFKDIGVVARTSSQYRVKLVDKDTGQSVFEQTADGAVAVTDVVIPVDAKIDALHDHIIELEVARDGIVLSAPVAFTAKIEQVAQLDPRAYVDPNGVREFMIMGEGSASQLIFTDITPNNGKVATQYELVLEKRRLGFMWKHTVAKGTFNRAAVKNNGDKVIIPLSSFPGMTKKKLEDLFDKGDKVFMVAKIQRVSPRLKGYSPITIKKEAAVRVGGGRAGS